MNDVYRNRRLLERLRDIPCGACNTQDGTVVAAHRNEGKGMGLKVSDALVAPLCLRCHYELDQGKEMSRQERRDFWNAAYIKGMQYLIENELLKVTKS